tara:strand:- start:1256 stop:1450 length:195 start_codon:yes stop_codon:yes gene_type:complete
VQELFAIGRKNCYSFGLKQYNQLGGLFMNDLQWFLLFLFAFFLFEGDPDIYDLAQEKAIIYLSK